MYQDNSDIFVNTLMDRHQRDQERRNKNKGKGRPKIRKRKPGGGRPPVPVAQHRMSISISLPPDIINVIEQERRRYAVTKAKAGYSKSRVIENAIRQTLLNDSRASIEGQAGALATELKAFYEIARLAKSVWGRSMSGLPGEVDGVLEALTARFDAYQRAHGIEPAPMPWEAEDLENDSGSVL